MMDIFELSDKTGFTLRQLEKIRKLGCLNIDGGGAHPVYVKALNSLRNPRPLSAEQLLYLLRNPDWLDKLGRYEMRAREAVRALGDAMADRMPRDLAAELVAMSNAEPDAIERGAAWVRSLIDTSSAFDNGQEQGHAFVAVRMLADLPEELLRYNVPAVAKALWNCRRHNLLKNYWRIDEAKRTQYRRPVMLDL